MNIASEHLDRSSPANNDYGERNLWSEVLRQAFYRAAVGEGIALDFFKSTDGMFSQVCSMMNLPEAEIRQRAIQKFHNALNSKRKMEE